MLCANQTSWAAKARRATDSTLHAGSRYTDDKFGQLLQDASGAVSRMSRYNFGSYLPTVWLASCLIRLNCFFILRVCAVPPGGRATSHISLIEWSQIYGRRRGSVFEHPALGNTEAKSSAFLLPNTAFLRHSLSPLPRRCWTDFAPSLRQHWQLAGDVTFSTLALWEIEFFIITEPQGVIPVLIRWSLCHFKACQHF